MQISILNKNGSIGCLIEASFSRTLLTCSDDRETPLQQMIRWGFPTSEKRQQTTACPKYLLLFFSSIIELPPTGDNFWAFRCFGQNHGLSITLPLRLSLYWTMLSLINPQVDPPSCTGIIGLFCECDGSALFNHSVSFASPSAAFAALHILWD